MATIHTQKKKSFFNALFSGESNKQHTTSQISPKRSNSDPNVQRHRARPTGQRSQRGTRSNTTRCACCRKRYKFMDTLRRVNPPKYCVYCREQVCKNCHSNDSCHRCFTRERSDLRTISRLEELDRGDLEKIMQDLHCNRVAFEAKEKSKLIFTIFNNCKMDKYTIKQYEEFLSGKKNITTQDTKKQSDKCNEVSQDLNNPQHELASSEFQQKIALSENTKEPNCSDFDFNANELNISSSPTKADAQEVMDKQLNNVENTIKVNRSSTRSLDRFPMKHLDDTVFCHDKSVDTEDCFTGTSSSIDTSLNEEQNCKPVRISEERRHQLRLQLYKQLESATAEQLLVFINILSLMQHDRR